MSTAIRSYEFARKKFLPDKIKVLMVAESPPPKPDVDSSRHFYRTDKTRKDDRLFTNTIKALYPDAAKKTEAELEAKKERWLRRFQQDGWYMIEALDKSLPHEVTKDQRRELIRENLPSLLSKLHELANKDTKIILIKSNVFDVAARHLRQAGFNVLNQELVDYPGRFNQRAFREKLSNLTSK